jgi:hypothetical protein
LPQDITDTNLEAAPSQPAGNEAPQ